jgi:hypothetical protein
MNRSKFKTDHLINLGLLVKQETEGRSVAYYTGYSDASRSSVLDSAKRIQKQEKKAIRDELEQLPRKGSGARRQELNAELQTASDVTRFIEPPEVSVMEKEILKVLNDPDLIAQSEFLFPSSHRTLVGPYGNKEQQPIIGATNLLLVDVMAGISGRLSRITLGEPGAGQPSPQTPVVRESPLAAILRPISPKTSQKKGKSGKKSK